MLSESDTPSAPTHKRTSTPTPDELVRALKAELTSLRTTLPKAEAKAQQAFTVRRLLEDIAGREWAPAQAYELETDLANLRASLRTSHLDTQRDFDLLCKETEVRSRLDERIGSYEPHCVTR